MLKLCAYLLATVLLGALLAPILFWAGEASGLAALQNIEFRRYFDRAMFLAALVLLWPAARAMRIASWRDLGLKRNPRAARQAAAGFLVAAGLLLALGALALAAGFYHWRPQTGLATGFLAAGAAAVGAGAAEELLFRGALFGLLARGSAKPWIPLVLVAALYAILHFLKPASGAGTPAFAVTWTSGFAQLPLAFWQFARPELVACGWTTLFLAGLILGWARLKTESLWAGFGLHAGWIFSLKMFARLTRRAPGGWPWFGENLLLGIGPIMTLMLTGAIVWLWLRQSPGPAGQGRLAAGRRPRT